MKPNLKTLIFKAVYYNPSVIKIDKVTKNKNYLKTKTMKFNIKKISNKIQWKS